MLSMIPTWVKWTAGALGAFFVYEKVKHPGVPIRQDIKNAFGTLPAQTKAKVIAAINTGRDPAKLRQLGDGLAKAGATGAAQMAHAKADALDAKQDAYVKPMQAAMTSDQPAGPVVFRPAPTVPADIPGLHLSPSGPGSTDVTVTIPGVDSPVAAFTVPTQFVPVAPSASVPLTVRPVVKSGVKNSPHVSAAQDRLIALTTGPAALALATAIALDPTSHGDFGPKTLAAVIEFQRSRGLTADGIIGPQTWSALGV